MPSQLGQELVKLYYKLSPPLATAIAKDDRLRQQVRGYLHPIARGVAYLLPADE